MAEFDFVITGAGFGGATIAESLARHGKRVLIVDRRPHVAGTAHDEINVHGIRVCKYGPHILNIANVRVFRYLNSFGNDLVNFDHKVFASVKVGQTPLLVPFPINLTTINMLMDTSLRTEEECKKYLASIAEPRSRIQSSEDLVVSKVGRKLYEKIYLYYSSKHWGRHPSTLGAQVAGRIPIHYGTKHYYYGEEREFIPSQGFTAVVQRMLDHRNIRVELDTDFRRICVQESIKKARWVYTGPLDELFDYRYGPLPYRTIDFRFETRHEQFAQPSAVMNFPDADVPYTRRTEPKHFPWNPAPADQPRTTLVTEYPREHEPGEKNEPLYPIPQPENVALYEKYRKLADEKGVICGGRMGRYKYRNIHEVVPDSLLIVAQILGLERWFDTISHLKAPMSKRQR